MTPTVPTIAVRLRSRSRAPTCPSTSRDYPLQRPSAHLTRARSSARIALRQPPQPSTPAATSAACRRVISLGACSPLPLATVAAGASITCPVSGTPTVAGASTVLVTTGATNDTNAANNSGVATINGTNADMFVDVSGLPTTATVGTPYSGTIKCTNSASATAPGLSAICSISGLPAGVTPGACSPLPPATVGINASISCPVSGTPTAVGSSIVSVTTGATNDPNAANNTGSATITAIGTPGLTVAVAASPTMFGTVGQAITFTYTVTNSGNVTVTGISVADSKVSPVTCGATTLAAGANTTCTGSYTTTASDVTATVITSVATAQGTFAASPVMSAAVTTAVAIDADAVRRATKSAIQSFLVQRADMITSMGPDTNQWHEKLTGSLFGGSTTEGSNGPNGLGGPRGATGAERPAAASHTGLGSSLRDELGRDRDGLSRKSITSPARPTGYAFSGSADDGAGRFAFDQSRQDARGCRCRTIRQRVCRIA